MNPAAVVYDQVNHVDHKLQETNNSFFGILLYIDIKTRPDIAVAVSVLGQYVKSLTHPHLKKTNHILRYL